MNNKVISVIIAIVFIIVSYVGLTELHTSTYVWQLTEIGPQIRPVHRASCSFTTLGVANFQVTKKVNIGMVYIYGASEASIGWSKDFLNQIIDNKRQYCSKHGYTLLDGNAYIDKSRPVAWSKLLAVKHYLPQYDYIFYIDMDTVIMNYEIKLEDFIHAAVKPHDIIMTSDWNGPNTGTWFARNSTWTMWFIDELYKQNQLVPKKSSTGIPHPFEYEQRAFHYLLQTEAWQRRSLPVYPGDSSDLWKHLSLLPQCAFNSYCLHPLDTRGQHELRHYVDGDFLVHFAGVKGQKKINLMNYYLDTFRSLNTIHNP